MVQRRAARFVTGEYRRTSSVSALIKTLGWHSLAHRRAMSRMTVLYRVTHGLVDIPQDHFTPVTVTTRGSVHHFSQVRLWKKLSRDADPVNNRLFSVFIICPTTQVPRPSQGGNCTRHLFWTKHLLHLYTLRLTQSTHITTTRLDNTIYIYRSSTISHCLLSNRSTEGTFILFQWLAWANATKRNYV